jgi:hypothetical protein
MRDETRSDGRFVQIASAPANSLADLIVPRRNSIRNRIISSREVLSTSTRSIHASENLRRSSQMRIHSTHLAVRSTRMSKIASLQVVLGIVCQCLVPRHGWSVGVFRAFSVAVSEKEAIRSASLHVCVSKVRKRAGSLRINGLLRDRRRRGGRSTRRCSTVSPSGSGPGRIVRAGCLAMVIETMLAVCLHGRVGG